MTVDTLLLVGQDLTMADHQVVHRSEDRNSLGSIPSLAKTIQRQWFASYRNQKCIGYFCAYWESRAPDRLGIALGRVGPVMIR